MQKFLYLLTTTLLLSACTTARMLCFNRPTVHDSRLFINAVLPESDASVERAARNIPGVKTTLVGTLNVYEILKYKNLVLTQDAVKKIEEVYA